MFRASITQTTRTVARSSATTPRLFCTTAVTQKTVTEKVAEAADKVNKGVGSGLADAIEVGQNATEKVKEAFGVGAEKTKEAAKEGKEKAGEAAEATKQKANEFKNSGGNDRASP